MQQLISVQDTAVVTQEDFERSEVFEWQQLLYNLCLFHSAANARRSYGREAWRIPYVFGPNDLQVWFELGMGVSDIQGSSLFLAGHMLREHLAADARFL